MSDLNLHRLTFAQFVASGRDSADLRQDCGPDLFNPEDYPNPVPGRVYATGLYLLPVNELGVDAGTYDFIGANVQLRGTLAKCEAELYGFYVSEVADQEGNVHEYLHDIAPVSRFWPKDRDSEDLLVSIAEGFCAFHGLPRVNLNVISAYGLLHAQAPWLVAFMRRWNETAEPADNFPVVRPQPVTPQAVVQQLRKLRAAEEARAHG